MPAVPLIDISRPNEAATLIDQACRETGFFCVVGHGVSNELATQLDRAAREFFALPTETKEWVAMSVGGRAWRGWFPLGGELTNGIPDRKEGFYFGEELGPADPRVAAKLPLHGPNLFPPEVPQLRDAVLAWMVEMTRVGHTLMAAISTGLGLDADWFATNLTTNPTTLFRIFHYPVEGPGDWGVAEHTDYGLLTLLMQDDCGGLQVKGRQGWVDVEPIANALVCNIGDMLERLSGGRYRSTPHRVRNSSGRQRLSFPFFFDPTWNARVPSLPIVGADHTHAPRWDGASVFDFDGTYGEYLVNKVSKVFPDLIRSTSCEQSGAANLMLCQKPSCEYP